MKDSGSHAPSGSFADLTTKPVNRVRSFCGQCGAGLPNRKRKFCGPCQDFRNTTTRSLRRAALKARETGK